MLGHRRAFSVRHLEPLQRIRTWPIWGTSVKLVPLALTRFPFKQVVSKEGSEAFNEDGRIESERIEKYGSAARKQARQQRNIFSSVEANAVKSR